MAVKDYVGLIKFQSYMKFLPVILTALLFADNFSFSLLKLLLALYISFTIFLYGGIYTINDIADIKSDRKHPLKRKRPLAAGKVTVKSALIFALALIALGLITGFVLFPISVFYTYLAFLTLNFFYTFVAKRVPYLELVVNSVTFSLRPLLVLFAINYHSMPYLLIFTYFFASFGTVCVRKVVEKDVKGWETNSVSKSYSQVSMLSIQLASFLVMLLLFAAEKPALKILHLALITYYIILVFGIYYSKFIRDYLRKELTK